MTSERRRLALGLLLSLLIHALLLSLTFGGQGLGLPGFGFPWQDRRTEAPDLRVALLAAPVAAAERVHSEGKAGVEQPAAAAPAMLTVVYPAPLAPPPTPSVPAKLTAAASVPQAQPKKVTQSKKVAVARAAPAPAPSPSPSPSPSPADQPQESVPPSMPHEDVIALAQSNDATWTVPPTPELPPPVSAVAPTAPSSHTAMPSPRDAGDAAQARARELAETDRAHQEAQRQVQRLEAERKDAERQAAVRQVAAGLEAARVDAARAEAVRVEAVRVEAQRQEAAKQVVASQDAARQEAARQVAAKAETARLDAERQEAEKQAAAGQSAARQEAARQELARAEAARTETERQEAARQAAARQDAARQDAARQEAARVAAARVQAAQVEAQLREAKLQAIGRQLNEEADRREAAAAAARLSPDLPSSWSSARRGRLFGRADPNAELIAYAQAWSRKIELNLTFDMVREAAKQRHTDPLVTVAIRSDGSVESVTFVRTSGVAAIDEAIRRIVHSQANYQAFPPGLLRDYDVVEIRRTWHFDMAVRLY